MNYKDLQNISYLSHQILIEASSEEHDVLNRWPYASPYLQEERAEGVRPYKAGPTQAEVRADAKRAAKKKAEADKDKPGYGPEDKFKSDWKLRAVPSSTSKRKDGTEETVSQRMDREAPYKTRPFSPLFTKQGSRTASAVTRATEGPGEPQSVTMPRKKSKPSREIVRKNQINAEFELWVNNLLDEGYDLSDYTWDEMAEMYIMEERYNLYDIVLAHLIDEGYTDTIDGANAIMTNMSEEWKESIVEGMFDFLPKSTTVIPGKYGKNTVLSKKGGVEGVSDKSKPGSFTPQKGGFDKMDAERYATQHSTQGTSSGKSGINLAGRRETSGRVK